MSAQADAAGELEYQRERAALFATGIGVAKLALKGGDVAAAYEALDHYSGRVKELTREWMRANGHPEDAIAWFLGERADGPGGGPARDTT